jgi:pimeloyl-ACP methyl ester carboxylesterase
MVETKVFFDGKFGKVCGVLHKVDEVSEIVIVVHGFSSNKETAAVMISRELNKIGVNAFRIDLDNHGESDLDFETGACIPNYVKQVEAAMDYCKGLGYDEISLVGTSYGGMVVFGVAMGHPEIKRMVLRVPVIDYKEHVDWFYGKEKVKEFKETGIIPYYNRHKVRFNVTFDYIEKSYPYSMYDNASEVKISVLIIQGDEDESVNPKAAEKAVDVFPNAKLHIVKGAGHKLSVNDDFSEGLGVLIDFFKS